MAYILLSNGKTVLIDDEDYNQAAKELHKDFACKP